MKRDKISTSKLVNGLQPWLGCNYITLHTWKNEKHADVRAPTTWRQHHRRFANLGNLLRLHAHLDKTWERKKVKIVPPVTYRITNSNDTSLTITLGEREREIEDRNRQCNHGVCMWMCVIQISVKKYFCNMENKKREKKSFFLLWRKAYTTSLILRQIIARPHAMIVGCINKLLSNQKLYPAF